MDRPSDKPDSDRRDSGKPGGGVGRRDEVGRSGVYPASGPRPGDPNAPLRGQGSWGQGERGAEGYHDSGTSEGSDMATELPEEAVGQGNKQKSATGEPQDQPGGQGQVRKPEGGDPNREPGDQDLYNEDKQGSVFYDKNTQTRRETEFGNATGSPVGSQPKVTETDDQFKKKP